MHRQVDRTATALLGPVVVPLDAGGEDLELTAHRAYVPAAARWLLQRAIRRIGLHMKRDPRQRPLAGHLAQLNQHRPTERPRHATASATKPSPDPSRLLASNRGWGYSKCAEMYGFNRAE